ncbi:MAG: hypothetical protein QME12_02050 [Nanoarchaeota archaeon]|nr:hypothetical protein [Nanoarchaeota archaeon]
MAKPCFSSCTRTLLMFVSARCTSFFNSVAIFGMEEGGWLRCSHGMMAKPRRALLVPEKPKAFRAYAGKFI